MFHMPALRRFFRAPGQDNALDYGCRLMVECSWEEMSELPTRSEHNPAGAPDRGRLVERASTHRKVLCGHSGPCAFGVGYDDAGEPVLRLSVPTAAAEEFPALVTLVGKRVRVEVQTNWKPPVPLTT